MWSVEYVQVPKEEPPVVKSSTGTETTTATEVLAKSPVSEHGSYHSERQVSRHSSTETYQVRTQAVWHKERCLFIDMSPLFPQ